MIEGLSHITLICADLDRTEVLLVSVLGATKTYDSGTEAFSLSPERFFDLGGLWIATMQGDPLPSQSYNHIAFKITEADYDHYLAALKAHGLTLRESRPRVAGEGRSLYFYDHDNHLFELHTGTLQTRLARYAVGLKES
jgi:catechol 2,3-dioxygenase-like lactoylglutathione lyase family enzyme